MGSVSLLWLNKPLILLFTVHLNFAENSGKKKLDIQIKMVQIMVGGDENSDKCLPEVPCVCCTVIPLIEKGNGL